MLGLQLMNPFLQSTVGAPALELNFAKTKSLDPRITFSRASEATYFGADGLLKTAAVDGPCFDHDPITLECKGLAIWESRTNMLTYSEQFDNAAWGKAFLTLTPNATTAPDGTTTADRLTRTGNATYSQALTKAASPMTYTGSVFVKGDTPAHYLTIDDGTATNRAIVILDLVTGLLISTNTEGNFTFAASTVQKVAHDFYRITLTVITNSTTSVRFRAYFGSGTYADVWGAQLEVGAFPSPYIPTVASAVTRAADIAQMTGSNFSDWYRQDEGSFVCKFDTNTSGIGYPVIFRADNGTTQNAISFVFNATVSVYFNCVNGGTPQASLGNNIFLVSPGVSNIISGAYKLNDFGASYNGSVSLSDNLGTPPMVSNFTIGHKYDSSVSINGHIAHLAYYPLRLSNTELQALSQQ